ncbi:MAG: hypothetical protein E6Q97_39625 [Desulfurellales bacterium]|nr:MAG: hypothetical protein E6Q97_39625 [Desulfurellales bacterium]
MSEQENESWGLKTPFWIDTDAYTDRDREMFCAGVEFQMIDSLLESGWEGTRPLRRENESRVRLLCARRGVRCEIRQHEGYEGCETWSDLAIGEPESR